MIGPLESDRVPVACPVQPGTEFYGIVPAPPPPSKAAMNAAAAASIPNISITPTATLQLCARLISSANDCVNGQSDKMKYTVSECVDQDAATAGTLPNVQTVFEGELIIFIMMYLCYYTCYCYYNFLVTGGLQITRSSRVDSNSPRPISMSCILCVS